LIFIIIVFVLLSNTSSFDFAVAAVGSADSSAIVDAAVASIGDQCLSSTLPEGRKHLVANPIGIFLKILHFCWGEVVAVVENSF
jgi:hypothetical protein